MQKQYQVDVPKYYTTNLWHIGLTYTSKQNQQFNNLQPTVWMNNKETEITIPLVNNGEWVIFNLQSTGMILFNISSVLYYSLIYYTYRCILFIIITFIKVNVYISL